jgi:inorganic pyrophosphatase
MAVRAFASAVARKGAPRFAATPLRAPAAGLFAKARAFSISTKVDGEMGTPDYRLRFQKGGKDISPWHDIPLETGEPGVFNCIIEIPKMTKPKMEVATKEASNPIAQDVKKGKLRDYHGPIFWNYGMFPQTWEDPNVVHAQTKCAGDNDPLDVVEIGSAALAQGTVEPVKVLGVLAMIDDGELDWKVIAISKNDALAAELNDIGDVEAKCPGTISGIREWFRWYKTPDNKPINAFGFDEKALDKKMALEVVEETNHAWKNLMAGKAEKGKLWLK